ncbi:MAG: hypothetical protein ACK4N5_21770 [Myxococcales bacterium]
MPRWDVGERRLIEAAMAERLEGMLRAGETLKVDGETEPTSTTARFVLEGGPDGARLELIARVDHFRARTRGDGARDLAIDALDLVLLEYLESGRQLKLSGVEEERELAGRPLFVRAERTFPGLDAQADALLQDDGKERGD